MLKKKGVESELLGKFLAVLYLIQQYPCQIYYYTV